MGYGTRAFVQDLRALSLQCQKLTNVTTHQESTAAPTGIRHFCIVGDADFFMNVDKTDVATTTGTSKFVGGDKQDRVFPIMEGEKVSVAASSAANIYICWMGR